MMKKLIAGGLLIGLLLTVAVSCKQKPQTPNEGDAVTTEAVQTDANGNPIATPGGIGNTRGLNGARILILGDESSYYGQTVLLKNQYVTEYASRAEDKGYLYQLCATRDETVHVTNWTWGGHSITDILGGNCQAGHGCDGQDHLAQLTERTYDYVIVQECVKQEEEPITQMHRIMEIFRDTNPEVRFIYVCHPDAYIRESTEPIISLPAIADLGVTVADWGRLVDDVIKGRMTVPDGKTVYDYNSFVIDRSEDQDMEPNLLSGYLFSLMLYGAMSGKSVVDMDASFCLDANGVEGALSIEDYTSLYYTYGTTNMKAVLENPAELKGLQTLVDYYLREKPFMKD